MADRYDDRYRNQREYERDRGFVDRASDEVRSWFGDDDAERRRQRDEMRERPRHGGSSERGWGGERWSRAEPYGGLDDGRIQYDRTGAAYRGWNEPNYGYRPSFGFGPGEWSASTWRDEERRPGETRGYYEDDRGRVHVFRHGREHEQAGVDRPRGRYAGLGPKGYRRSDARIHEDVCDRLAEDPYVDASDVEVAVRDGEVTLTGIVRSRHEKRDAEETIESIPGVRDVHNQLRVERWQPSQSPLGTSSSSQPTATPAAARTRR
jgi:osmotically-inducible protein OsmY